ncbi:hypothetical protein [Paraburkholderia sp. J11-2]|uniref:hypothetical protein n=1 Tax=Paraburkholderia sp. J11-2 TaxID=2805431 RepID=UPI002AB6B01E|nr:hypothetical protein [Paraburkholderia sp. J11-2]
MNCELNDLAVIVHSETGRNLGKIVEVVKFLGESPEFNGYTWCTGSGPAWLCEAKGTPISVRYGDPVFAVVIPDVWLKPVSGLPIDEEVTEDLKELA